MNRFLRKFLLEIGYANNRALIKPDFVSLVVTERCNLKCQCCDIWRQNNVADLSKKELKLSEWQAIVKNLVQSLPSQTFVEVNGGEPLLRFDLVLKLIKYLKKHFQQVTLNTNGFLLNEGKINQLIENQLNVIKLSWYSHNHTIHDQLRGIAGSGQKNQKTVAVLKNKNIKLEIAVVITASNIETLPDFMAQMASQKNLKFVLQPLNANLTINSSSDGFVDKLWPSANQVGSFFGKLPQYQNIIKNTSKHLELIQSYYLGLGPKSIKYRCFAGFKSLIVLPDGQVKLCFQGQVIGNLLKQNLGNLLNNAEAKKQRQLIKKCAKSCRLLGCNCERGVKEWISGI